MAEGGVVTIRAILDASGFTSGASKIKSDLNQIKTDGKQSFEGIGEGAKKSKDDLDGLGDALGATGEKTKEAGNALTQAGQKIEKWGAAHKQAGETISKVGGVLSKTLTPAVIGVGTASVAAAVNIDTSLTNVRKTVDGTEEDYQRLKEAAIEFSKTNAVSASQILDIQALGAQLGFSIDELQEFGEVVSGLDIATNMDAETAATQLAQFANITGLSHDKISNFGSAIVDLGNNFATTEADISNMAMRIAGTGTTIGLTVPEILGMATALSSVGIEAEAGGTAISTIMSQIDKDVAHGSDSLQMWADVAGMSADQFAQAWQTKPAEALSAVILGMANATDESGALNLMLEDLGITAIRQGDALKRLANNPKILADAMGTANTAFDENIALSNEVENRNNSLAAKFEMLKNRAVAVGDQIGGPLASALLDAIDAAQPLFEAIENGAKAFSNMSKEEQQSVLLTAAFAAALGPILSIGGKLISNIGTVGKVISGLGKGVDAVKGKINGAGGVIQKFGTFLSGLGKNGTTAHSAMGKLGGGLTSLGSKISSAGSSASGFGAILGGLSGGPLAMAAISIGALIPCIIGTIDGFRQAAEEASNLDQATNGLNDAISVVPGNVEPATVSITEMGTAASGNAKSVQELLKSQAQLVDKINETNSTANTSISQLMGYRSTIEELAGTAITSEKDVARLKLAVEGINDACGTNYEVVQNAQGAYVVMADGAEVAKDAILRLIDAKKQEIVLEANKSNYQDAYNAQAEAADTLTEAQQKLNEKVAEYGDCQMANGEIDQTKAAELEKLRNEVNEAQKAYDSAEEAVKRYEDAMTLSAMATEENASAQTKFVNDSPLLQSALIANHQSVLDFAQSLKDAGVNTDELGAKGDSVLQELAAAYDGSFASIAGILEQNGIALSENKTYMDEFLATKDGMAEWAETSGMGLETVAQRLTDIGLTTSDLATLTPEQLGVIAESWGGTNEQIIAILDELNVNVPEKLRAAMEQGGQAVSEGGESVVNAADQVETSAANEMGQFPADAQNSGQQGVNNFNASIAAGQGTAGTNASGVEGAAAGKLGNFSSHGSQYGQQGVNNFNSAIRSGVPGTNSAATSVADASQHVGDHAGDGAGWGDELAGGFVGAIRGWIDAAASAASAVANAVASFLHFSKPDIGPLSEGTEIWGQELVENLAKGMARGKNHLALVTDGVASVITEKFDDVVADARIITNEGLKSLAGSRSTTLRAINSIPSSSGSIDWNSTRGIYNSLQLVGGAVSSPIDRSSSVRNIGGSTLNLTVRIDHFENSRGDSVDDFVELVGAKLKKQQDSERRRLGLVI